MSPLLNSDRPKFDWPHPTRNGCVVWGTRKYPSSENFAIASNRLVFFPASPEPGQWNDQRLNCMVLTDAMALVVCVSFDCPYGPGDIITDEVDGKLIKPDDLEGFAEALVELMNSTERRVELGQKARKKAAAYHPEMIVNQWNQLFQSLLQ